MIAYNKEWLDALLAKDKAEDWHNKGLLSDETWKNLLAQLKSNFYTPNVFVRIGLGIFCFILVMAAMGLIALTGIPGSEIGFSLFMMLFGMLWFAILELRVIEGSRHLRSGIDDVLLYVGVICIITAFSTLLPYNTNALIYYIFALPILILGSLRYIDRLMTIAAFYGLLAIIFLIVKEIPKVALYLLPFSGMLYAAGIYFLSRKAQQRYEWRHWHPQLNLLELLGLLTFYASGNYWVIQQAGAAFFQLEQVPIPWFFWAFTFVVPVAYIVIGLRRKERLVIDIGLGCVALAVFTFRYFYHVLPLAWTAAIAGAVLFFGAYFSIRYLRQQKGAYTYEADGKSTLLQEIEEQLIEQTIVNQPVGTPTKKDSFGGGAFGGSGASGEF